MSEINQALSELSTSSSSMNAIDIEKANVPYVRSYSRGLWLVGGLCFSLTAYAGWNVHQQNTTPSNEVVVSNSEPLTDVKPVKLVMTHSSPAVTSKLAVVKDVTVFHSQIPAESTTHQSSLVTKSSEVQLASVAAKPVVNHPIRVTPVVHQTKVSKHSPNVEAANHPAQLNHESHQSSDDAGVMEIETVQVSPVQLAAQAITKAQKAMNDQNIDGAIAAYKQALHLTPHNETVRQELAALYYGKQDMRNAYELLQKGIKLNLNGEALRLNLSQLLLKEKQYSAALLPLMYLPTTASEDYLAMRAAIAQKIKKAAVAQESYQLLVKRDPTNARWWLGLAIEQDRQKAFEQAKHSYQQALNTIGISYQSQQFILGRLSAIKQLQETSNGH